MWYVVGGTVIDVGSVDVVFVVVFLLWLLSSLLLLPVVVCCDYVVIVMSMLSSLFALLLLLSLFCPYYEYRDMLRALLLLYMCYQLCYYVVMLSFIR